MPTRITNTLTLEELIVELTKRWHTNVAKLAEITATIETMKKGQDMLIVELDKITHLFHDVQKNYPAAKAPTLVLPLALRFVANPNLTIGDAMEMLLIEHGPMMQKDLIDALRKGGMRFSSQHPHVILANAVRRDTKNRFKRLSDGRVALTAGKK